MYFSSLFGILPLCSPIASLVIQGQPSLILPPAGSSAGSWTNLHPKSSGPSTFVVGGASESLLLEAQKFICNANISDSKTAKRACNPTEPSVLADQSNVKYDCDNQLFSLEGNDCRDAWQDMPGLDRTQFSFGNRTAPYQWDVPLPFRFISHNGKCAIEIDQTEQGSVVVDGATGEVMADSAWKLIRQCADTHGRGGTATGLGKKGRLTLSIKEYKPNVECETPARRPTRKGPMSACTQTLNKMQVSRIPQVFGRAGGPGVQVGLPTSISDGSGLCKLTVDIQGAPIFSQWYDVWAGAVAVTGMCLASGKWGMAKSIEGGQGASKITIQMTGVPIS